MKRYRFSLVLFLGLLLLGLGSVTLAQGGTGYILRRWSADGGGATGSTVGAYTLGGTAGQFDAGTLNVGAYTLRGGFWGGGPGYPDTNDNFIFLPLILRNAGP